jgi:translation initiation factor 1 (eIF-1/SUI1)
MSGFFTRSPKDIELSVSSVNKFVSKFRKNADNAGYKEGVDYRITGQANAPKIEFKINGAWEKGVEVFSKNKSSKASIENEVGAGYRSEAGIAYGFKGKKSIKADKVKMMKLQEQAARKFAGGTTLKDGKIELMHGGRVKDVRDLIEIGTAYEVTGKLGIAKEIVTYAKIGAQKNPAILESPIVRYIVENGKLPSKAEILKMTESVDSAKINTAVRGASTAKGLELIFSSDGVNISKAISKGISERSKTAYVPNASKELIVNEVSKMGSRQTANDGSKVAISKRSYGSKSASGTTRSKSASSMVASKRAGVSRSVTSKHSSSKTIHSKLTGSKTTTRKTSKNVTSKDTASKGTGTTSKTNVSKPIPGKSTRIVNPKTSRGGGNEPILRVNERNPVVKTSKKKKNEELLENERDLYRMKRTIHNTLGNMESFFGGSTTKKTTKKRTTKRKSKTK